MASPPPMVALESLDEQCHGMRVEFQWQADRYVHSIYRVLGGTAVPYYSSIEGTEEELFPASPCLFDLHQQQQVLFLTGATSTCHWSLSVQAQRPASLVFEVACRLKAQASWLGSTYKVLHPEAKEALHSSIGSWSCETMPEGGQQFRLFPAVEPSLEFPTTLQWNYAVP